MFGLIRSSRLILPLGLLLAGIVIYLAFVRPRAVTNDLVSDRIEKTCGEWSAFIQSRGGYPTEASLQCLKKRVRERFRMCRELMTPARPDRKPVEDGERFENLESLFKEWGFTSNDPIFLKIRSFEEHICDILAPEGREAAALAAKILALSFCHSGLGDFDQLQCQAQEETGLEERGGLRTVETRIAFQAGLSDALRFIEEWCLSVGEEFLLEPVTLSIRRIEPGQWVGDLQEYLGPPVSVELAVRIYFNIDKGPS